MAPDGLWRRSSDGLWVAPYRDPVTGKTRYAYGATAETALAKRRARLDQPAADPPLREWLDDWLGTYLPRRVEAGKLALTTLTEYRGVVERYIRPHLAHLSLSQLTPRRLDAWLHTLSQQPSRRGRLSPRTVGIAHETLRACLSAAVRYELLPRNPASLVEPPAKRRRQVTVLSMEQSRAFARAIVGDPLEACWALLIGCALRIGEARALTPDDVDLDTGTVRVAHSLAHRGQQWHWRRTKTGDDTRLALPRFAVEALERRLEAREFARRRAGDVWADPVMHDDAGADVVVPLLICRSDGGPLQRHVIQRALDRVCIRAGVPRLTPHELRHNSASLLRALGVSLADVQHVLRHSTYRLTADLYSHLLPEVAREHADRLDEFLGGEE